MEGMCPKCGRLLQIPEELTEFSCLYCGARLNREALRQEQRNEADIKKDYDLYAAQALHAAVDWPDSMQRVTKTEFFSYFEHYYQESSPSFSALERWVLAQKTEQAQLLSQAAALLMEQIEAWFPTQKGWKHRAKRTELVERTKFTVAIFMVPTIRKCAPIIGDAFCEEFRALWLEKHPDSTFALASYQELADGFKKRPFCFITTAVCEFRGEADDCEMLTAFRAFRDGYLRHCPDGEALIAEYYNIAPGIVSRIQFCEDREKVYSELYQNDLLPCYQALQNHDPSQCRALYMRMMYKLQN